MTDHLQGLTDAGVSIWLDDLSRERLETGNLAELVKNDYVVGVTTNPLDLRRGPRRGRAVRRPGRASSPPPAPTSTRRSSRSPRPTYATPATCCGRSSTPPTAWTAGSRSRSPPTWPTTPTRRSPRPRSCGRRSTGPTCSSRSRRPPRALRPSRDTLAEGISVNVTLIFGLDRYQGVMEAYVAGLEKAQEAGHDLSRIHSVASFFVSRVDTEIDNRLNKTGASDELLGKAGVANARLAYEAYEKFFSGERWERLEAAGANRQRPLWASTGVKNPDYKDTMYVADLVVENTVNTMPEKTLDAVRDHGEITRRPGPAELRPRPPGDEGPRRRGIDYDDVIAALEEEGVEKFVKSWDELLETVKESLEGARRSDQLEHGRGRRVRAVLRLPRRAAVRRRGRAAGLRRRRLRHRRDGTPRSGAARPRPRPAAGSAWVGLAQESRALVDEIVGLRDVLADRGCTRVVLCGMGGSSLAPEVICATHGVRADGARLLGPRLRTPCPVRPARAHHRGRLQQVRRDRGDRQPEARLRAGVPGRRPRAGGTHRRRHRPGLPAGRGGHRGRLPRVPRQPRRGRPLLAP